MIWVDYVILAVIGISALISVLRGFMREAISLAGWILAFWIALTFAEELAAVLERHVSVPTLRIGIAFFALFISTLLVTALVNFLVGLLVETTGLSGTDRMLGIIFGAGRGVLVVELLVILAGLTALPQDGWWHESMLIGHFERLAVQLRGVLPPEIADYIKY